MNEPVKCVYDEIQTSLYMIEHITYICEFAAYAFIVKRHAEKFRTFAIFQPIRKYCISTPITVTTRLIPIWMNAN